MDLTRLYNLTTPELREEAERMGVGDTYAMSRGQLIHAIRNQASGSQPPEGLLNKVLGFAKWALQAAQEEPTKKEAPQEAKAKRFSRPSEAPETGSVSGAEPAPAPGSEPVSAPVSEPVPVSAPVSEPVSASVPESAPESVPVSAPVSAPVSEPASVPVSDSANATSSGPPSRPPAGVFSKSAGMFEEPFPTRTMARILAEQGHFKRALAIYAGLLRDEPGDRELSAEANEVRARSRARRSQAH